MELKSLLVDSKTTWVEFPGLDGFEVELANLSRKELVNLRKRCVQNNINWTKHDTLHESLNGTMMYPKTYTIDNRVVSGTIQQYQIDANITQHNNFSTNSNITIKAVEVGKVASDNGFWAIQLNPAMYTARLEVSQVYTQSYDFRSTGNTAIGTQITQYS